MSLKKINIKIDEGKKNQKFIIGRGALNELVSFLNSKNYSKIIFFVDENAGVIHKEKLDKIYSEIKTAKTNVVFRAEKEKTSSALINVLSRCVENDLDRRSCLVGIGGGKVGDIVGLAASLFMRGIDFVQVGTTLMSQVDGIIGKTAVDFQGRKNIIGSFSSPVLSICDPYFLKSNSKELIRMGLVEVIKHAFIKGGKYLKDVNDATKDKDFLSNLSFDQIVFGSIYIKSKMVSDDLYDTKGEHAKLSYGHTIANAIEEISKYGVRHGSAVAVGMAISIEYSKLCGVITDKEYKTHKEILGRLGEFALPKSINAKSVFDVLTRDKNAINGTPRMLILKGFGKLEFVDIDINVLIKSFNLVLK